MRLIYTDLYIYFPTLVPLCQVFFVPTVFLGRGAKWVFMVSFRDPR